MAAAVQRQQLPKSAWFGGPSSGLLPRQRTSPPCVSGSAWQLRPPKRVGQLALTHAHLLLQKPLLLHSLVQRQANPFGLFLLDDKLLGMQTQGTR